MSNIEKPLIGPEQSLPEITVRGIILSIILTIILCASNAYLGLKVGNTISASIPAAIISMAVLRFFRNSNVLENNIVQTAASVGEALVSGVAYVIPSLLILGYWNYFHFWSIVVITLLGGSLGMLFSIPVRRIMLNHPTLRFPEGTAIGAVLKASANADAELKPLVWGGAVGGIIALFQTGFQIVADGCNYWMIKGKYLIGFGLGFSPALIAAGYIVGVNVSISMLVGTICGWFVGIPVLSAVYGVSNPNDAVASAMNLWTNHVRYIGVGTMLVGGIWTILTLIKPICDGIFASFKSLRLAKAAKNGNGLAVPRTERDIPIHITGLIIAIVAVCLFFALYFMTDVSQIGLGFFSHVLLALIAVAFVLTGGFLFASIAAYFAGLVGSTNNPVSGLIISSLLIFSLILLVVFGLFGHVEHTKALAFSAFVILECAVVGCITAISTDTMQDLKAGQIVGATPWKQQVMLLVGIIVASFVIAPILQLLFHAYGIGGIFPHPGMPVNQMLAAPQATLMAAVVQGVFGHNLPWAMLITGAIIAVIAIGVDEYLKTRALRFPILAVGLGIYLPLDSSMPMIIGGFLSYLVQHMLKKRAKSSLALPDKEVRARQHRAILLACGIVAGASLMGVVLAIPFAIKQSANALALVSASFTPIANLLGVIVSFFLCMWIYRVVIKRNK